MELQRGQRVIASNDKHGTLEGTISIVSTNKVSVGVLLDEPYWQRLESGALVVCGALLLTLTGDRYIDFFDNAWEITLGSVQ